MATEDARSWMKRRSVSSSDLYKIFHPTSGSLLDLVRKAENHADEVHDRIYVGDEHSAGDITWLSETGITHVINTAYGPGRTHCKQKFGDLYKKLKISLLNIPAEDVPSYNLLPHYSKTNSFIKRALKKPNAKVFVHCKAGLSRSPSVVLAYLMMEERIHVSQAASLISEKRFVNPNSGFLTQLCSLQEEIEYDASTSDNPEKSNSCIQS